MIEEQVDVEGKKQELSEPQRGSYSVLPLADEGRKSSLDEYFGGRNQKLVVEWKNINYSVLVKGSQFLFRYQS